LRNDKQVVDRAGIYFSTIIGLIDQRRSLEWPTCPTEEGQKEVEVIAKRLKGDFEQLRSRARALSEMRTQLIQIEMNTISILESKKGLQQAERVGLLTFLAYLFIPLTFISSVFRMNVTTFTSPNPSLWAFFATAIPFTLICLTIPSWREIRVLYKTLYNKVQLWRGFRTADY
jgi:Mg2+ and Co2+ transporter CorA